MNFKIEKGVPMPAPKPDKYPFSDMQPGDSFEVSTVFQQHVRMAANHWGRRHSGEKFTVRKSGVGVHRCWRVS
jgi:hypothetical protein